MASVSTDANGNFRLVFSKLQRAAQPSATGWKAVNLRTTFLKIIKRAGVEPWPWLFHNLRASCQTELEQTFPSYVVCAWMGNSESVAKAHYLQVLPQHFEAALKDDAHSDACSPKTGGNWGESETRKNEKTRISAGFSLQSMGGTGFEQPAFSAEKHGFPSEDDADSDASSTGVALNSAESPCLLARLAAAWNRLTDPDRAEVVELSERLATHPSHPTSSDSN